MNRISTRLVGAFMALFVLAGAVLAISWVALREKTTALEAAYLEHIVPIRDLKIISDAYAVQIVDAAHKVRNGNIDHKEGVKAMLSA